MSADSKVIRFETCRFDDLSALQLHEILRVRAEVFALEQRCLYLDPDEHDLEAIHVRGLLNGHLVAYARYFPKGDAIKIGRVLTTAAVRGTGAGKQLMRFTLDHIGARPCILEAQAYLASFYAAFGFRSTGPIYELDNIPHLPMRRTATTEP